MKTFKLVVASSAIFFIFLYVQGGFADDTDNNTVYGWNLMSEQERIEHRETMRNLNTAEERERYRIEHHKKMQERANERGVSLPDIPHSRMMDGSGMGSGGMRNGSGMGQGR